MTTNRILVVCTANRCRSPIAAAVLVEEARRRGLAVEVSSAGLLPGGQPVPPDGVRVAAGLGLDVGGHRSRTVQRPDLTRADLIVTMTREHARTLVAQEPSVWPRIFTLKQLPRWLQTELAATPPPRRTELRSWLESVGAGRDRRDLIGRSSADDVVDPYERSPEVWQQVVGEIRSLCRATLDLSLPLLGPLVSR